MSFLQQTQITQTVSGFSEMSNRFAGFGTSIFAQFNSFPDTVLSILAHKKTKKISKFLKMTLPTLFLSHGGGPSFFMKAAPSSLFSGFDSNSPACHAFKDVGANKSKYGLPEEP